MRFASADAKATMALVTCSLLAGQCFQAKSGTLSFIYGALQSKLHHATMEAEQPPFTDSCPCERERGPNRETLKL